MTTGEDQPRLPQAVIRPEGRLSWVWLVPLLALALAGWLGYRTWSSKGIIITVQLEDGHGLRAGDPVRYRGISVGQVGSVEPADDLDGVIVTAGLSAVASGLARAGTRLWVVRPQLGATGVAGLETLVGPRYLAMLPGDGPFQRNFVGLSEPPVVERIDPGDLEIVLEAPRRGGVRRGAPVLYRQVRVGTVMSVGLSTDGGSVEARVHIQKAFVELIREQTRFWIAGGITSRLGIGGVTIEMESIESVLAGGVALATPPHGGEVARTGHRFRLEEEPEEEWLEWEPRAVIGSPLLPAGAAMPSPVRAVIGWKTGRWIRSEGSRRGWLLPTERGLLGPVDLLRPPASVDPESVVLEVAGRVLPLGDGLAFDDGRIGLLATGVKLGEPEWTWQLQRRAGEPEDCIAVSDPAASPLSLAAARLTVGDGLWRIDPALLVDESWHGASVLARADGYLVGVVVVDEDRAGVALLPEPWPQDVPAP